MNTPLRAALYLRLSSSDDDSTSIARQEADLRELAAREGWEVIEPPLIDDGISGRKARANATEALRMIADREADVLAVWKFDRWTRQGLAAVGDLVRTLDASPGALFVALRDGLRSDQQAFDVIAGVVAGVAKMEAENTAARVRSSIAHLKAVGRFHGGVIPLGYDAVPNPNGPGRVLVVNAAEAALVREVADRILRGESMPKLALDLTRRGVPTVRSDYRRALKAGKPADGLDRGQWRSGTVQQTWTSAHLLGYVKHGGEYLRGDDGLRLAVWPPVLDRATYDRILARVRNPKAPDSLKRARRRRAARLLSGLAFCAGCGARMHVGSTNGTPTYACPNDRDRACERPRMKAENAERTVVDRFLAVVGSHPELELVEIADPGVADELSEIEAGIREALDALANDDADAAVLFARVERLKGRRAELRNTAATTAEVARPTGRTYAEAWETADLDERRRLLGSAIDHVTIRKLLPTEPRKGLHRDRVAIVWANEPSAAEAV